MSEAFMRCPSCGNPGVTVLDAGLFFLCVCRTLIGCENCGMVHEQQNWAPFGSSMAEWEALPMTLAEFRKNLPGATSG